MEKLNQFLPNLKFRDESSQKKVAFLNLNVSLENGCITPDLYIKSTDCHQYLHCSSAHPDHLKSSIIYGQTLEACTRHRIMVFGKVKFGQKKSRELKSVTGVLFVITYRPKLKEIA